MATATTAVATLVPILKSQQAPRAATIGCSSSFILGNPLAAAAPATHGTSSAAGVGRAPALRVAAAAAASAQSGSRRSQVVRAGVESKTVEAATSTSTSAAWKETVKDTEISLSKTSFGSIGLTVGVSLLTYGFGAYFTLLPGSEWSAIMLTYGFPVALIGFALKYAELKPVECASFADAVALRESQATPILLQVRSDVTRFRYGDEQHLEEALKRIFRYGQSGGIQRRSAPILSSIAEEVYEGRYSLVMKFNAPSLKQSDFEERQAKFTSFFGPGVEAIIESGEEKAVNVRLVATGNSSTAE
eukprot:TRINITY_DN18_c0_g1_i2.p1 TRINITY_DN18_c0_g1~~TRINITY_DN18_c0_g1_i2.p1  ORF type:complete len:303 (+),score=79.67 TRINITY_DN18_c0_g1_i2:3-911(+)